MIATHALIGDVNVSRLGYGAALRVDGRVGEHPSAQGQAMARRVIRRAMELGAGLIDTADSYGPGYSETLLAEALYPYAPGLMIATKGGVEISDSGQRRLNGRPAHLRRACEASLRRLRLDVIDLYQLHWPDPKVPFADQLGALAELRAAGMVRHVGLCNVTVEQAAAARRLLPIASIQCGFGITDTAQLKMVEWCAAHGVAFIAYRPLAVLQAIPGFGNDLSARIARAVAALAARSNATTAQIALAWLLRQAPHVIAIPGTTSIRHLEENMAAVALAAELPELDQLGRLEEVATR